MAADADPTAVSVAAPYDEVLRALPAAGPGPRVLDETGACLGRRDPTWVRAPGRGDGALIAAIAGDFLAPPERRR